MSSDGHKLRESWSNALTDALSSFKHHISASQSSSWRRVPGPARETSSGAASVKGKEKASPFPTAKSVFVHRKTTKKGDLYRVIVDVPAVDGWQDLEAWKAVFATPELRKEWDPSVESSSTLEMFDPFTRIVKTKFTLGWPANPRDAVMIARSFSDSSAVIDIATSLPRSKDEPAYLRPAPPYVRSNVDLLAWCVQLLNPQQQQQQSSDPRRRTSGEGRLRVTCFIQHDLRTVWNIGTSNIFQQLSSMMIGLLEVVKRRQTRIPALVGYGFGVSLDRISFDCGRDALALDYSIVPEDEDDDYHRTSLQGLQELNALKEQRRLTRSVEIVLPSSDGWDMRISARSSSDVVAQLPWNTTACRMNDDEVHDRVCFQVQHAPLIDDHTVLKIKLVVEYSGALKGIRLNGLPHNISADLISRDLETSSMSNQLIQDAASVANFSVHTGSSLVSTESEASSSSSSMKPPILRSDMLTNRPAAIEKSILSRVRRSYIYFSSLLQEPDAKWRSNTDQRGVSVTQLDSIDPTLVVFKAEATFVGVGLWDLYSAVVTPGARAHWDKQFDDAILLEDVNELSELWHFKTKPAWPVVGRDSVVLKTVYKSPTTIHVFGFSVDDTKLFEIPSTDPNVIRTQIDLQGWAIEALSPTTTQLTLLEQSDPKGWSGKSTIPQQMIANIAGVGEFAIKFGGPPLVTRLGCAKAANFRYEHDRGSFRVEYMASSARGRSGQLESNGDRPTHQRQDSLDNSKGILSPEWSTGVENALSTSVECELRCDVDTWTSSLDIVVDPPPQSLSCLRRHKLSAGGGGLWLTVGHDIALDSDERILVMVRRAPFTAGKERGMVMVNGKRIAVDVEELLEAELKSLSKQKRIKPVRIPLDQPPVLGAIRRRRTELDDGSSSPVKTTSPTVPKAPSPLANFFTAAMESARSTTQQAIGVLAPPVAPSADTSFPAGKAPLKFALDALSFAQAYHRGSYRTNWSLVSEKGIQVHKRPSPELSANIPIHRSEDVLEGVAAEDVASVVYRYDHRSVWDDRFSSATVFEEYGANCCTSFLVSKGGFPFRDRGFYLATMVAKDRPNRTSISDGPTGAQSPNPQTSAIYCVSASFNPESVASFSSAKYNPTILPVGRVIIDAWILETLDPYTAENFAIPSTRCTRLSAIDYAGSIPVAVNAMINAELPRAILSVASYMKKVSPYPEMRLPTTGYQLVGDPSDLMDQEWSLRWADMRRRLMTSSVSVTDSVLKADVVVSLREESGNIPSDFSPDFELSTPKAKRNLLPSRPSSPDTRSPLPEQTESPTSPPTRHRRGSSSLAGGRSPSGSLALRSKSRDVLRSSSSTFTIGREFRTVDFVVSEIIVDLRLYPEGYEVTFNSCLWNVGSGSGIRPIALPSLRDKSSTSGSAAQVLPISSSIHLLPPPLYASNHTNSDAETPTRHLVRLTLPTAQFDVPTIVDPLTGETRSAPPKPAWLISLEGQGEGKDTPQVCAIVHIEVRPLAEEKRKSGKKVAYVNDTLMSISGSEKDIMRMGTASTSCAGALERIRHSEGEIEFPALLNRPLGIASDLLEDSLGNELTSNGLDTVPTVSGDEKKDDTVDESESKVSSSPSDERPPPPSRNSSFTSILGGVSGKAASLDRRRSGLWNWWTGKPKDEVARPRTSSSPPGDNPPGFLPSDSPPTPQRQDSKCSSSTLQQTTRVLSERIRAPQFSISTLVAAVLIAFLIGSLLRSLLSPADFIYVVTDLHDVPGYTESPGGVGRIEPGWREIKRLLEVKYLVGGWDFQVAVVRRH